MKKAPQHAIVVIPRSLDVPGIRSSQFTEIRRRSVDLVLEVKPDPDRPLVGIRYELKTEIDPEEARPVAPEG